MREIRTSGLSRGRVMPSLLYRNLRINIFSPAPCTLYPVPLLSKNGENSLVQQILS